MNKPLAHLLPAGEGAPFAAAATRRAVYIALSGENPPTWPALRAAERAGHLSDAIHLRRLNADAAHIITTL